MPGSSSSLSETRPDHSVVEQHQTDDYFQSNNEVRNSAGAERYGDQSKILENEKFETSEKTSISREFDLDAVKRERGNGELTREPRTEPDKSCFIGGLAVSQEVHFVTGSSYAGSWDALGMAGVGKYVLPNGTIYEGEIRDGMFHGHGSFYWSENQRLDVLHLRGELIEHRYTFHDGPVYDGENWNYCKFPDRRFHESIKKGLRPGGRTRKTARQSATILPSGCFDTGDGVFDPKTQRITSYADPKKLLRLPTGDEYDWIVEKCRKSWTAPTGYRPDLNENWSEKPPELPYNLPMSRDSPDHWWRRLATFARDRDILGARSVKDGSSNSKIPTSRQEVCSCGQMVIIGKPCCCAFDNVSSEAEEYEISERTLSEELSDDTRELKRVFLSESPSTETIEPSPRGRLGKRSFSKKINDVDSAKVSQLGLDYTSKIRGDFFEDSFVDESLTPSRGTRETSTDVKLSKSSEKSSREVWEKNERAGDPKGEGILSEMSERNIGIGENLDFQKVDTERMTRERVGTKGDRELTDFKRDVNNVESSGKSRENTASDGVMANYVLEASDEKRNRENIQRRKDVIGEETLRNSDEKNQQKSEMHKRNVDLSKHADYTADSIPREKVTGEPETRNDRSLDTKLLQGNVSEKHLDHESIETETMKKKSPTVFRHDHGNDDGDEMVEHPTVVHTDKSGNKAVAESSTAHGRSLENIDSMSHDENANGKRLEFVRSNESTTELTKKLDTSVQSISSPLDNGRSKYSMGESAPEAITRNESENHHESTERKNEFSHAHNIKDIQPERESRLEFVQIDKSMTESENESERTFTPSISKEGLQISDVKSEQQRIVIANLTDDGKSSSVVASVKRETLEKSDASEDDVASLDKVHPSLATLSSTKQEPSEGKDIIEVYRKCPKKGKQENLPMNTNVWHLSSAKQKYGPKTKIENLLFHPALTAPRSDNVEYVRKPCDYRVCEKTSREVKTTASHSRKEHTPNFPAKSSRSSDRRNLYRKK